MCLGGYLYHRAFLPFGFQIYHSNSNGHMSNGNGYISNHVASPSTDVSRNMMNTILEVPSPSPTRKYELQSPLDYVVDGPLTADIVTQFSPDSQEIMVSSAEDEVLNIR